MKTLKELEENLLLEEKKLDDAEDSLKALWEEFRQNVIHNLNWLEADQAAKSKLVDWIVFFTKEYWASQKRLQKLAAIPSSKRRKTAAQSCRTKVLKLAKELRIIMDSERYEDWRTYMSFGAWSASHGQKFFDPEASIKILDDILFAASNAKPPTLKNNTAVCIRRTYCRHLRKEFVKIFPEYQMNVATASSPIGKLIHVFLEVIEEPLASTAFREELRATDKVWKSRFARSSPTKWLSL